MSALRQGRILWLRVACFFFAMLIIMGSQDLYLRGLGTGNGEFLGAFSIKWGLGLIGYGIIALGIMSFAVYGILQPQKWLDLIQAAEKRVERHQLLRWILAFAIVIFPVAFILSPWGWRFDLPNFRVLLLACFSVLGGFFLPISRSHWLEKVMLMILLSSSLLIVSQQFMQVSDYPFATSWSEGNRLWDYSLYFEKDRYNIKGPFSYPTYLTPGRHGLWGLPFLFLPNPSIVMMRIWDVVLWTLPYFLLGLALFKFRKSVLTNSWQWIMVLWTFLFLSQGPIYAPLVLSGMILALGYHREHLWRSLVLTTLACFYAGISRWTWMVAPAVWAVLWVLIDGHVNEDFWKRIRRPFFLGVAGLFGAILSLIFMDLAFPRPDAIYSTSLSQPLLWYRLWASATNPTGIVRGLVYAVGPVLVWLIWMIVQKRARWDLLKILAVLAALLAFLVVGLTASVKIGGGSNIHNLDMFLVSLVFLVAMIVSSRDGFSQYPGYALALLTLVLFLPVWNVTRFHEDVEIPEDSNPQEVISEIRSAVQEAAEEGEVLFIDQRQLFTFGEITGVPLIMEYELKHMMNQAMAHNQAYYEAFRFDLENHRFRLIVSDPLYIVFQGPKIAFGEENDAWVEEVTIPVLEYYEPVMRFDRDNIWLLAPKEGD